MPKTPYLTDNLNTLVFPLVRKTHHSTINLNIMHAFIHSETLLDLHGNTLAKGVEAIKAYLKANKTALSRTSPQWARELAARIY